MNSSKNDIRESDIAIIAMSGRFPGAKNIDTFWENLRLGVESISWFSDEELLMNGVPPELLQNPNYVRASAVLDDIEFFDANFFGFNPKDAEILDPQQRLFLECAWGALEQAGYHPQTYAGSIGVYAGLRASDYLLKNLYLNPAVSRTVSAYQLMLATDKDLLPTRVAYKLNFTGPAVNIQTACSTSLVAVHMACQSLLNGECDMALAGAVTIRIPQKEGYLYQEGMIASPDGHCRAFDAKAQGTLAGNGVGIVMLKRATDALADGDYIHAIIKGSAINNDGTNKIGFTAPSVEGQAAVIGEAQAIAGIDAETITYIEAHGTGTELGDPIEIAALTKAFYNSTKKKHFCAIGSVKTNIGHLDTAAGMAGLIKTVLALKHKQIPPTLHFESPNPTIDFANSPFYVNTKLSEWKTNGEPRRAGVSSFGIGGTNAHIVLEEAPVLDPRTPDETKSKRPYQLLVLSAKTSSALDTATKNLTEYFKQNPELNLADIASTLSVGRQAFEHRRILVCSELDEAVTTLPEQLLTNHTKSSTPSVIFMFSGQGSQYVNMAREIYLTEAIFREQIDRCAELLQPELGLDLRDIIYPSPDRTEEATKQLQQTAITQPALFTIEYALAKLWESWGIQPQGFIGHSIGEYVAACLAGVFSLEDALCLVAARGRMMQQLPPGAMLSVPLAPEALEALLGVELSVAAINEPCRCVVSGTMEAVANLLHQLGEQGIECIRLRTSHAFHSQMMEPILKPFAQRVKQVNLNPPQIPYLSNVTGKWITAAQATDPDYWAEHLRHTVQFALSMEELLKEPDQILLEVGPGKTLSTLVKRHPNKVASQVVLSSTRHPQQSGSDVAFLLNTLGQLWLAGVKVDWSGFYAQEQRYRVPLPTYPFERQRYWISPQKQVDSIGLEQEKLNVASALGKKPDIADWFYIPSWKRSPLLAHQQGETSILGNILAFTDECGLGEELVQRLAQEGHPVVVVKVGESFIKQSDYLYILNPGQSNDYDTLLSELRALNLLPNSIIHLLSVTQKDCAEFNWEWVDKAQDFGFYSLLYLAQALGKQNFTDECQLTIVSNNMQEVAGEEWLCPEKATLIGPVKVIPREYSNITCLSVDIVMPQSTHKKEILLDQLLHELKAKSEDSVIAYRGNYRLVQTYDPVRLEQSGNEISQLREGGVYLITGGLGGIGFVLAEHLANTIRAKLILTGRSGFPDRSEWKQWLDTHDEQDEISRKIRKIEKLEANGSEVLIVCADLANQLQMQEKIAKAMDSFGKINGVIHTAGVPAGGVIQLKTLEMASGTLAAKVKGTLVLDSIFKDMQLDWFVLCSSLTSIVGGFGQVDYCAANAFLDSFAHYKTNRDGTKTISINWDTWQEVGMAVEAAKRLASGAKFSPAQLKEVTHPLFDQCIVEGEEQAIYITQFSVNKHWVLNEHRLMGKATLPGTAYLEMVRAAFENHAHTGAMELREVFLMKPLVVEEDEEKEVRTLLKKRGDGWEFSIISRSEAELTWQEHARGEIFTLEAESPQIYDIEEIEARCNEREITLTELGKPSQTGDLKFGPRWEIFRHKKIGENRGVAIFELPEAFVADVNSYKLHPALLDGAINFLSATDEGLYLPFSFQKLRIKQPLPAKVYSYMRYTKNQQFSKETLKFDITIMDEHGRELMEIEEYTLRKFAPDPKDNKANTEEIARAALPNFSPSEKSFGTATPAPLFQQLLKHGLLPTEGVEVFHRILCNSISQILVSTQGLETEIKQAKGEKRLKQRQDLEESVRSQSRSSRPALMNAYVAPRNEMEQIIAQIWQDFLGIESIGIYDDFFELGGDSLLGIQLTSKLSKTLQKKISPNSLLNAPTIATLAEFLEMTNSSSATAKEKNRRLNSSLLVQLHKGSSQKQPFFLIHPVGGSVYSYRYLAYNLEADLPVYGLQARGLDGEGEPLTQIEEMAKSYLGLLQTVQPVGPYHLGGWSLGGLVAFEIAQQLHQQGQEVSNLVMIDSFTPTAAKISSEIDEVSLVADFASYTGNVVGQEFSVSVAELKQLNPEEQLQYILVQARKFGVLPPEIGSEQIRHRLEVFKANSQAMARYTPQPYLGRITFFCADESMKQNQDPSLGWASVAAGSIITHNMPGNHYSIIESEILTKKLRTYLN
ncbi:type I polyketide synthase [Microcoleus asticus]|uniref:Phthiocerol synthesis polyketide synthase type I PpsE n=1 Tax=Microcoleus asticus IPMA8 TaxID=2563858 RepID=A0ABX2CWR1_9CYAN|nr:type I polyketide synthase [Microcoleus asticus]NQE34731.1 Phthiocerol synthesis polyketide synthase type I PpsE [Microcoleus asticus IPMA8]